MKRRLLAPALLLVLGTACNKPQDSPATPTPPTVPPLALKKVVLAGEVPTTLTTFDSKNSPLRAAVNRLNVDAQGRLWVCAGVEGSESPIRGLAYFDGTTWTPITRTAFPQMPPLGTVAHDVAFDNQGTTWIASMAGLVRWKGTEFVLFPRGGTVQIPSGLGGSMQQLAVDRQPDHLWFQYQHGGIGRFVGTAFDAILLPSPGDEIGRRVVVDDQGITWLGMTSSGLTRSENGQQTSYLTYPFRLPFTNVFTMAPVPNGGVWFTGGTSQRHLLRCDGTTFTGFDLDGILGRETSLTALRTDAAGRLYLGTSDGMIFRMNTDGSVRRMAVLPESTPVNDVAVSADGTVWASQRERLVRVRE